MPLLRCTWAIPLFVGFLFLGLGCESSDPATPSKSETEIESGLRVEHQAAVGKTQEGQSIDRYVLSNSQGMRVSVIDFGAIVTSVEVPDRDGKVTNVTLGFEKVEDYKQNSPYLGAICGRFANRIAGGQFTIQGKQYTVTANEKGATANNLLHGGKVGFNKVTWKAEPVETPETVGVKLTYISQDGEEGFPGTLTTTLVYSLNEKNEFTMDYTATTDKPTVVNLTNHCYWNLVGSGSGDVLDHELTLHCDKYLPADENLIPTGELAPVKETPMDFTGGMAIGARISEVGNGYDHCYVVRREGDGLQPVAKIIEPRSGRVMEILSTEPGVQLYTGNFLNGTAAVGDFAKHHGFCLECSHYPDSPNHGFFPSTTLLPGDTYRQTTVHRFSVEK
jgi:aldose 1-epimerase